MKIRATHQNVEEMKKNLAAVNILPAQNGKVFEVRLNEIGLFSVQLDFVSDYSPWHEGFKFNLPKIPNELLYQIVAFFKSYCAEGYKEVMAQIFWDREEEKYFVYIPTQIVTDVTIQSEINTNLEQEKLLVMDIHSHNIMPAFFSSIDDDDEKETRLYGVLGRINTNPEMKLRIGCGGKFLEIGLHEIFEDDINFKNIIPYPEEWHDRIFIC